MEPNQVMGNFTKLPPELRLLIWQLLPFSLRSESGEKYPWASVLNILRTSRHIYAEASEAIYGGISMAFIILPEYKHKSWFQVSASRGFSKTIQNFQDAKRLGFKRFPYSKLKQIVIAVEAPSPHDQGQLICLWKKCLDVAELLEHNLDGFQSIHFDFVGGRCLRQLIDEEPANFGSLPWQMTRSKARKWSNKGEAHMSLSGDRPSSLLEVDFVVVLQAFWRLQNVKQVKVHLLSFSGCKWVRAFEAKLQDENRFSSNALSTVWVNHLDQEMFDNTFMDIELELSFLSGVNAHLMRIQRLSSWYEGNQIDSGSRYEQRIRDVLERRRNKYFVKEYPLEVDHRGALYILMRECKPGRLRCNEPCWHYELLARTVDITHENRSQIKSRLPNQHPTVWDSDAWHTRYENESDPLYEIDREPRFRFLGTWHSPPRAYLTQCRKETNWLVERKKAREELRDYYFAHRKEVWDDPGYRQEYGTFWLYNVDEREWDFGSVDSDDDSWDDNPGDYFSECHYSLSDDEIDSTWPPLPWD